MKSIASLDSASQNAGMLKLPDELLILIAYYLVEAPLYDRNAYAALTSLAMAHPRFTNVVRETLQQTSSPLEITNFVSKDAPADNFSTVVQHIVPDGKAAWRDQAQNDIESGGPGIYSIIKKLSSVPSRLFDITFDDKFRKECIRRIGQSKLETLAKPVVFDNMGIRNHAIVQTPLSSMSSLAHLVIPAKSKPYWVELAHFPQSLQRISICDATEVMDEQILEFMSDIYQAPDIRFQYLESIEILYPDGKQSVFEEELVDEAESAGIELNAQHPKGALTAAEVGGQVWKLQPQELEELVEENASQRHVLTYAGHWCRSTEKQDQG
ncbi:hypothetical protein CC86DRAFT_385054 [Ophiobolus disseminans]|uniref:Uncharacterized protein n=1 Tax=Ophiobolus disseminans TaxID=1469910 RepID=A0A6A6ZP39_9PLEO|nr:hypothetical protein CC86DRAFT_385054 [Ophiobolus disseminans]